MCFQNIHSKIVRGNVHLSQNRYYFQENRIDGSITYSIDYFQITSFHFSDKKHVHTSAFTEDSNSGVGLSLFFMTIWALFTIFRKLLEFCVLWCTAKISYGQNIISTGALDPLRSSSPIPTILPFRMLFVLDLHVIQI